MGAGGNLFGRAISYFVNEIVVEGLANKIQTFLPPLLCNQAFQRFAVKTSRTIQELSAKAEQSKRELVEQVKNSVEEATRNHRN